MQSAYLVATRNDFHNEEFQIDTCLVLFIDYCVKVAHFRACHRLPNVEEEENTTEIAQRSQRVSSRRISKH